MVNVLHILEPCVNGGIFRVFQEIQNSFKIDSEFNTYVLGRENSKEFNESVDNVIITKTKYLKFIEIKSILKKYNIKIIHLHGFDINLFILSFFIKLIIIYTNHGLLGTGRKLRKHEIIKKYLLIIFIRYKVKFIINISGYAQKRLIQEYGVKKEKTTVVYNSSSWDVFNINREIYLDSIILGFHGRFVRFKRIDRLFYLASILKNKYYADVEVVLLGDGPLKDDYSKCAADIGIKLNILQFNPDPQIIIKRFNYLIVPSDEEYFGLSVIEGIRSGVLTFVFKNGGGCVEIFQPDYEWFVCDNEEEMADKIMYSQKNFEHVQNMFNNLQKYVVGKFSIDNFHKGYKKVYLRYLEKELIG